MHYTIPLLISPLYPHLHVVVDGVGVVVDGSDVGQ